LHVRLKTAVATQTARGRGFEARRHRRAHPAGRDRRVSHGSHGAGRETENGEEVLDLERLTGDEEMSPIIKLVYTVVLNALERRASDIHIETRATVTLWSSIELTALSIARLIRSTLRTIRR
jgi:type II secretory ATPase GspE/PulE/Tfp pilus assembly ATPase PilB-like protein